MKIEATGEIHGIEKAVIKSSVLRARLNAGIPEVFKDSRSLTDKLFQSLRAKHSNDLVDKLLVLRLGNVQHCSMYHVRNLYDYCSSHLYNAACRFQDGRIREKKTNRRLMAVFQCKNCH